MANMVMIIDDDADDREFFCEALTELDSSLQCVCAKNGFDALDLLNNIHTVMPDYIFLDMNMPLLNGLQCLGQIKKSKKLSEIPVIIFTTSSQPAEAEAAIRLGAELFSQSQLNLQICWICLATF